MRSVNLNGVNVQVFGEINLDDLLSTERSLLPNLPSEYVIYVIHNNINNKNYVGQTKEFFTRFIGSGEFTHKLGIEDNETYIIYKAIRKYGINSFTVYIIEELDDESNLNEKEKYWINELHTCIYDPECWGYNMTWGGDNCDQLNTPKARAKAIRVLKDKYNGDIMGMCHTKEAIEKCTSIRRASYDGDAWGPCNTLEAREKANLSIKIDHIFTAIETYLIQIKEYSTNVDWQIYSNHISDTTGHLVRHVKGVLSIISELRLDSRWTDEIEAIFSEIENNPDPYLFSGHNNEYQKLRSQLGIRFKIITDKLNLMHSDGAPDIITHEIYWDWLDCPTWNAKRHITGILDYVDDLRLDPRWTDEMERIFSGFESNRELYTLK